MAGKCLLFVNVGILLKITNEELLTNYILTNPLVRGRKMRKHIVFVGTSIGMKSTLS